MTSELRTNVEIDFFISHASEDKETFVRLLAIELLKYGAKVYYDEFSLNIGDSISESINNGLSCASHCIIVISPSFMRKNWTIAEINAIIGMHVSAGKKIIPIFHEIDVEEVRRRYPMIADIKGTNSNLGFVECAQLAFKAINKPLMISGAVSIFDNSDGRFNEGFSFGMGLGFQNMKTLRSPQIIMQLGVPNTSHNMVTLLRDKIDRILCIVLDNEGRSLSSSIDIGNWKQDEIHFLLITFKISGLLSVFVDNILVESVSVSGYDFSNLLADKFKLIQGCGLQYELPGAIVMSTTAIGKYMDDNLAKVMSQDFMTFLKSFAPEQYKHFQ